MFRVTCIDLENGEFALYINGHYLSSEDGSGEKLYLGYSGTFIPSAWCDHGNRGATSTRQ